MSFQSPLRLALILPYISSPGGGVTEAVRLLAHGLSKEPDVELTVISYASDKDEAALKDWPEARYKTFAFYGPARFGFSPGMAWYMMRHKFDVVHCHGIWTFHVFSALMAMLRGAGGIVSPHGMLEPWILKRSARLKQLVSRTYQNWALRKSKVLHALTDKEIKDITAVLPRASTALVPNFVPPQSAPESPAPWYDAQLHGERMVFLFLGRIHDKKGWKALLEAWDKVCAENSAFQSGTALVFCGWLDDVPDFETCIAQTNARTGNVIYAGSQFGADKLASFAAADAFLLPSQSEGLPMVILEAVRGDAVIAMSRECNLPEFLEGGAAVETGHMPDTIAPALERVFHMSPDQAETMRQAALELMDQNYSEASVVSTFMQLYQKMKP